MSSAFDGIQRLERHESLHLLRSLAVDGDGVGRVAYVKDGRPVLRPVTYAVGETGVMICTHERSGLIGAVGTVVSFEVDELEPALHAGWSVIVTGVLEPATAVEAPAASWAAGRRTTSLRIALDVVTGVRIVPPPGGVEPSAGGARRLVGPRQNQQ